MKLPILFSKILLISCLILPISLSAQWLEVNSGTSENLVDVFFIDDLTGFCAGSNGTLLKSMDGGLNWEKLNIPSTDHIVKVHFITKDIGFLQTNNQGGGFSTNAIYKSIDGGSSWNSIMDSFPIPQIDGNDKHARTANFYLNNKYGVVNFLYSDNPQIGGTIRETWKTSDFGENWTKLDESIRGHVIILDSLNWFNGDSKLKKTTDGGLNWQESGWVHFGGFAVINFDSWHIHDGSGKGVAVAQYHLHFYKFDSFEVLTANPNANWEGFSHVNKMEYIDSFGYYLFYPDTNGDTYIRRTTNDAEFFLPQIDTLPNINDIAFQTVNLGWACGKDGAIYKTTNGGTVSNKELEAPKDIFKIFPNPSNKILNIEIAEEILVTKISLYTVKGQVIKSFPASERSLNVQNISSGTYFLKVSTAENVSTKKVIIE